VSSYRITDFSSPNLHKSLDRERKMMYVIDEIGGDFVVVNGERIEVDPPFESVPDKREYENWLNGIMANAVKTIGSRAGVSAFKNYLASVDQRGGRKRKENANAKSP